MRIDIYGLGYVGTVTGACLADVGHDVTMFDISEEKVALLNDGFCSFVEKDLPELVDANVRAGRLKARQDRAAQGQPPDVVVVCVGTPTGPFGDTNLHDVEAVTEQIGGLIADWDHRPVVIFTSTIPPGTVEDVLVPILAKASGKEAGRDFGAGFSPEFLREASAVSDYLNPSKTIVGTTDEQSAAVFCEMMQSITTDVRVVSIRVAETVKFVDNSWHALKVAFTNEVARFSHGHDVDAAAVMDLFMLDTRQNISATYLRPGFAFGGSCLPKDLRTVSFRGRIRGVSLPLLDSVLPSNEAQINFALEQINDYRVSRVALLGLSFKAGTDDLRESPLLTLAERLIGSGYDLRIHDDYVDVDRLIGANRSAAQRALPHISSVLSKDLDEVVDRAELVVIGHPNPRYRNLTIGAEQQLLDLCGILRAADGVPRAKGLAW